MTTSERLAVALEATAAPKAMVVAARAGCYDDFRSESATPCHDLVRDALAAGLGDIARRAMDGEFDATREEAEEWAEAWLATAPPDELRVLEALAKAKS
jgi:hypothetical protein